MSKQKNMFSTTLREKVQWGIRYKHDIKTYFHRRPGSTGPHLADKNSYVGLVRILIFKCSLINISQHVRCNLPAGAYQAARDPAPAFVTLPTCFPRPHGPLCPDPLLPHLLTQLTPLTSWSTCGRGLLRDGTLPASPTSSWQSLSSQPVLPQHCPHLNE